MGDNIAVAMLAEREIAFIVRVRATCIRVIGTEYSQPGVVPGPRPRDPTTETAGRLGVENERSTVRARLIGGRTGSVAFATMEVIVTHRRARSGESIALVLESRRARRGVCSAAVVTVRFARRGRGTEILGRRLARGSERAGEGQGGVEMLMVREDSELESEDECECEQCWRGFANKQFGATPSELKLLGNAHAAAS